jgi:D-alanyl-lipoteichoic acid acyltransferase DltB (MBOAT superfamily)
MLFDSFRFLFWFLPLAALVHAWLQARSRQVLAQAWLLAASLLSYAWAAPAHLPILLGSILFNWLVARTMMRSAAGETRKRFLQFGLAANIALLCAFKYLGLLFRMIGFLHGPHWTPPDWGFPLGISFFTLTQVMYLVDTYQGLNDPHSLFDHAAFVSLFPYVASGPLVRARSVLPQFRQNQVKGGRAAMAARGLYLFSLGLAKKVVLADAFAGIADKGFGAVSDYSMLEAWVFAVAFLLQLYFDFSGYSDMAVGSAWMLGIDIPQNFNAPLRARSISEFWQRWHISLSNFITNYLYTPIVRSFRKPGLKAGLFATVTAMAIAGLWHGPAWKMVLYGLSHGIALAINQVWKRRKMKMPDWAGLALTQLFAAASLVFFRSADVPAALHMLARLAPHAHPLGWEALRGLVPLTLALPLRPVFIGAVAGFCFKSSADLANEFRFAYPQSLATAALLLISFVYMNSTPVKSFVYFAF